MAERELRSIDDFLNLVEEICKSKGIKVRQLEKEAGISLGMISRWRKSKMTPTLKNVLKILRLLDVKIILHTNELKDNSEVEEENNPILDEDTLLVLLMVKILKSEIDSSDKEKLYKILKAFV